MLPGEKGMNTDSVGTKQKIKMMTCTDTMTIIDNTYALLLNWRQVSAHVESYMQPS